MRRAAFPAEVSFLRPFLVAAYSGKASARCGSGEGERAICRSVGAGEGEQKKCPRGFSCTLGLGDHV